MLLRSYNWNVSNVHEAWFADEDKVRKAVGLLDKADTKLPKAGQLPCGICFESYPLTKISSAACGHPFCNTCWTAYISTSINDGPGCLTLRCPTPSCGAAVGVGMVNMLSSDEDKTKYRRYRLRSYIEDNKKTKWCPAPGCDCAIEFEIGSGSYDVTCHCSYSFCWNAWTGVFGRYWLMTTKTVGMALLSKASISSGMNSFIFVVYRQAFATLSLAPFAYFFERKNAAKLSYTLIWKIFFSSLIGITICLNMYYHALHHTSATFAAASTNLIPSITFVIAIVLRMLTVHYYISLFQPIMTRSRSLTGNCICMHVHFTANGIDGGAGWPFVASYLMHLL